MPLTLKICGLSEPATLDAALDAGADMVGFVFFARSPRNVALDTARTLGLHVEGRAKKVALTVDADDDTLGAIIAALAPDVLQLHGQESLERVAQVRATFGLPVMKALAIGAADDLGRAALYDDVADFLLFDAPAPTGGDRPGGNAAAFDWTLLRGLQPRRPWLLAGGLDPDNVAAALRVTHAPGVDVSSGVERAPGLKDPGRIARFAANARSFDTGA